MEESLLSAWQTIVTLWGYQLATIDEQPITVSKIVSAVLLFVIGIYLSKVVSRFFAKRIFNRFRLTEGVIAAIESFSFYFLVIFFALFALRLVNVPLTIFTVLGGAVAIGVGFGSQNIVNNFISGLILLVEQPIRSGDLVEIGQLIGKIQRIGLRSTIVRTSGNIDIIVPNSSFLEKDVVNWTLGDNRVRFNIKVGVAYGSATQKVRELLLKAAGEHSNALKTPEPLVWFQDFGDNALIFELHFWSHFRTTTEKQTTESDLRFRIDELFREAGIVIAFPQRDVHFFNQKPIEVRMLDDR